MESTSQKYETNQKSISEQIRGSVAILVIKLALTLFIFEAVYALFYYTLSIGFALPFDWHHHISVGLLITSFGKIVLQTYFIIWLVLSWSNNLYLLTDNYLIKRVGIFSSKEEVIHFGNIRSISVNQSFFGKLLNYGDLTLKTSASGGYQEDVVLTQIDNPSKYEEVIKLRR